MNYAILLILFTNGMFSATVSASPGSSINNPILKRIYLDAKNEKTEDLIADEKKLTWMSKEVFVYADETLEANQSETFKHALETMDIVIASWIANDPKVTLLELEAYAQALALARQEIGLDKYGSISNPSLKKIYTAAMAGQTTDLAGDHKTLMSLSKEVFEYADDTESEQSLLFKDAMEAMDQVIGRWIRNDPSLSTHELAAYAYALGLARHEMGLD